jgi:hypothetical protein
MLRFVSWLMRWTVELWDDLRDPDWKRSNQMKPTSPLDIAASEADVSY